MPQTNYTFPDGLARAGMLGTARDAIHAKVDSKLYTQIADVWTIVIGGSTADGDYSFTVDGVEVLFDRASAEDDDAISDALVTAGEAETDLDNVAAFTDSGTDQLDVTALHRGDKLDIADETAPSGATLVATNSTDSDKANLGVGIFVARDSTTPEIRPLTSTDTDANIAGVSMIGEAALADNTGLEADVDGFPPNTMVSVVRECDYVWMVCEDAATEGGVVHARKIATGTEVAGACRASSDGTAQVTTATPTASQDSTAFQLVITFTEGPHAGESYVIAMTSDASMTATEVCDDLRTDLNAQTRLAGLIADTGTATLILTAVDPEDVFIVVSNGVGTWSSITTGTAGAPDTVIVSAARFDSTAAAGALVKVRLNRP